MNETYLEAGKRGKNTWSRYLLGVVFILFMWFVVGGRASLALGSLLDVSAEQIAKMPSSPGLIAGYLVLSASFPFSCWAPCSRWRLSSGGTLSRSSPAGAP